MAAMIQNTHQPATIMLKTGGTSITKKTSLMYNVAVLIIAIANLILLNMQINPKRQMAATPQIV